MSAIYPHTVTVYNRLGEQGRAEAWRRTVLEGAARLFAPAGTVRAPGGDRSPAAPTAIIAPEGYVDPRAFGAAGDGWTLRSRDMVAEGAFEESEPPQGAMAVSAVEAVRVGARVHHVEATF